MRALDSGVNTSYSSAAACPSKNAISFCLSCCLAGAFMLNGRRCGGASCCSTISASSARPPRGSATNGLMSTDWMTSSRSTARRPSATSASTTASTSRPRAAAIALEQLGAAHAREHVAGLVAAHRRRAEVHVLDQFEQHAAGAGHHHQPHLAVAVQPEHQFHAAANLLTDQHAGEAVIGEPPRHLVVGLGAAARAWRG